MKKIGTSFMNKMVIVILCLTILAGCGMKKEDSKESSSDTREESQAATTQTESKSDNSNYESETDLLEEGSMNNNFFTDEEPVIDEFFSGQEFDLSTYESSTYNPISTFSIDVDTASYSMIRRYLEDNLLPPASEIRIEEMINYFNYNYSEPSVEPFSINTEVGICPWNKEYIIARIGLNGKSIDMDERPRTNLVFLLDVSGSMDDPDKLPLLKESFKLLVDNLTENDRVSIVVYAGASGSIIEGARGDQKDIIMKAIDNLEAGGSTAGSEGIELAYDLARKYFIENGNNRVILATDGDFNVGLTSEEELLELIENKREKGIFLSAIGFGSDSRNFETMELLADNGNGQFAYIDSEREARKVLIEELGGTLYTIAKDVKIQVEFNPAVVLEYALIGYENRLLEDYEFNDDKVDAGDIGAGHQVTALYMIKLRDEDNQEDLEMRYQETNFEGNENELMFVKLRYKEPDENESKLISHIIYNEIKENPSLDFNFACSVAEFGLALRGDFPYSSRDFGDLYDKTMNYVIARPDAYKIEFVELISSAEDL